MDRITAHGRLHASIMAAQYDDRCTIRRIGKTTGADMGSRSTETIIATDVPCKLSASSGDERVIAGATEGRTALTVRMPAWEGVRPLDLDSNCYLDIAARGEVEAQTLHVIAPLPSSGLKLEAVTERTS